MQKIMIIEDEPSVREELAILLNNEGYQALVINDFVNILNRPRTAALISFFSISGFPDGTASPCAQISTAKQASQSSSSPAAIPPWTSCGR